MTYELWDTATRTLIDESDELDALAELKVEYRDADLDISHLRILEVAEDGERSEVVE